MVFFNLIKPFKINEKNKKPNTRGIIVFLSV